MSETGLQAKLKRIVGRMDGNFRQVRQLIAGRAERAERFRDPLRPGQRPQDIFAVLLFTVGLAVVVLDIPTYPWIRSLPPAYLNTFATFTDLGKAHWILWTSGVICLALLAQETGKWRFRLRMAAGAAFTYGGFIFFTVAASGVLSVILKWSLGRARPKLYDQVGPVEFDFFAFHGSYTSFPSGHSTTVGAFAAALALIFPSWRWLILVAAFWVAFSRCFVGAHYPSDVIAGTLLGVTFTFFTARALARRRLGFHITPEGRIEPIMSARSAKACVREIWRTWLGRQTARRAEPMRESHDQQPQ